MLESYKIDVENKISTNKINYTLAMFVVMTYKVINKFYAIFLICKR